MGYTEWARGIRDIETLLAGIHRRQIAPIFAVSAIPQVVTRENVANVVNRLQDDLPIEYVDSLKGFVDGVDLHGDYHGEEYELMSCVKDGVLTEEFRNGCLILRDFFGPSGFSVGML